MAVPYFLWDEPMTVTEFRSRLKTALPPERARLLGKLSVKHGTRMYGSLLLSTRSSENGPASNRISVGTAPFGIL